MRIAAWVLDADLLGALEAAAAVLDAELTSYPPPDSARDAPDLEGGTEILVVEAGTPLEIEEIRALYDEFKIGIVAACPDPPLCDSESLARADQWVLLPASADELVLRIKAAHNRRTGQRSARQEEDLIDLIRYRELLFDKLTGFPTLPVVIQHAREILDTHGELTILYIHFVWFSRLEELYGWQKLDDVLETSASAVQEFYDEEHPSSENLMLVAHAADDDFILFTHLPTVANVAEQRLRTLATEMERHLRSAIERVHGEDVATLGGVYVGTASVSRNPKIRAERLIYRGIREATTSAQGALEWEQTRKIDDLRETIRDGAVYMEYHPIIRTNNEQVYGFEALARGVKRELRSPEVLLEVAAEANMLWELGRLLRTRAIQGISQTMREDQFLFLNIDPHDFNDPQFRELDPAQFGIEDPASIVLEITERTAIKDYPRFQGYLAEFRERGFRFAVDDAGSGFAGLGSIANLEPDYIKLDISLISNIDTNFLKQNLVETMVSFAENQGVQVIAEGVERREEFDTIRQIGVHLTQGFLFHRPSPAAELIQ